MDTSQRIPALIAYLPVIGWIYLGFFERKNDFAHFHLRQSIGLFLSLILVTAAWAVAAWVLAWIPYAFVFGIALFALPLTAYILGAVAWVTGIINALRYREAPLPLIGGYSSRLPIYPAAPGRRPVEVPSIPVDEM